MTVYRRRNNLGFDSSTAVSLPNNKRCSITLQVLRRILMVVSVLLMFLGIFQLKYADTIPVNSFNDFALGKQQHHVNSRKGFDQRDYRLNVSNVAGHHLEYRTDAGGKHPKHISTILPSNPNPRFPQKSLAILPPSMQDKRVLVVYSGPTELTLPNVTIERMKPSEKRMELYRLNFEFFLQHGIQCSSHDTILVVTDVVASNYQAQIDTLHAQCQQDFGHYVQMIVRENKCFDLESVRVALHYVEHIGRPAVFMEKPGNDGMGHNVTAYYDFTVLVNSGMTGPSPHWAKLPWTNVFLQGLRDGVKMTGLTMNCERDVAHIQSMLYAVDREGLQIIVDGGAIFDCAAGDDSLKEKGNIIRNYELRMGQLLLQAGYGISSVLRPTTIFEHNRTKCLNQFGNDTLKDIWLGKPIVDYFGKMPSLDETIFFKTSRILTPDMAKVINFTAVVDWNWI